MSSVLNIAAYRFVTIDDPLALREAVRAEAARQALKGTVLIAPEGINFFLAGDTVAVEAFLVWLKADTRFAGLPVKRSRSATVPFRKLLVKCKAEIITMRQPTLRPSEAPAPSVAPRTLKAWLDQGHDDAGRPVVLLDTRNAFEVARGSFTNAIHPGLGKFSEYPEKLAALASEHEAFVGRTVVTFCTGGIRCEKAAPWMLAAGYRDVVQLEGGILQYFEDCGAVHFEGDCFVFDERIALDGDLRPDSRDSVSVANSPRAV